MIKKLFCHAFFLVSLFQSVAATATEEHYELQPGDVLDITVWKEPDLSREVLVGPDGRVTLPLIGSLSTTNLSITDLEEELKQELEEYVTDPSVTVSLRQVVGSRIYVVGKVNRPGMFLLDGSMDVMQALSLAGGTTSFADLDSIKVLRREDGIQRVIAFKYNRVARGANLRQNVLLMSGDTVVVP